MDPLSALSVASSVMAFVDFGSKLVARFGEIKGAGKGRPLTVMNLEESADELSSVAVEARKRVKHLGSGFPRAAESLARLDEECAEAETQLKGLLEKMTARAQSSRLRRLEAHGRAAFRAIWSEKQVEEWREKLERIRNQIMMNVLMCLWDEAKKTRQLAEGIDGGVGSLIDVTRRIEITMHSLEDDFQRISVGGRLADSAGQTRIADAIWESSGFLDLLDSGDYQKASPPPIAANLEATSKKILESLRFEGMTGRGEQIATTYPETFGWLFERGDFTQWLQSENGEVFWVTGKPASGKSTLMKFISTHPSLYQSLQRWAGDCQLCVASFYFWSPGSKSQKSRVGLLRSLLYQLLLKHPELCRDVAPRRQIFFDLAGLDAVSPDWQWAELRESLLRFASKIQGKGRLALFIDGLDEYDGNHDELVAFLKQLHRQYKPKLCVSSRPWNVFSDEFRYNPSLRMETFTKDDIDIYIKGRLGSNLSIQELRRAEPDNMNRLMKEIRTKAEGVFLWVVLVVEQLLEVSRDHPHLPAIWDVFNSLPRGLEELYEAIQQTVSPLNQEIASKLYQLVMEWKRTWNGQIGATFLWFALDCVDPLQRISYPNRDKEGWLLPLAIRALAGNTKGILQVSANASPSRPPTVDFLHRTAFDWLRIETNWFKICSQGPQEFQPTVTLAIALVSHLRSLGSPKSDTDQRLSLRAQYIFRILKISGDIESTPDNRAKIMTILDQIEPEGLLPLPLTSFFAQTHVTTGNRPVLNGLLTLAAAFCCLPYLQAKADANPYVLKDKGKFAFKSLFSKNASPISLLEASVLGVSSQEAYKNARRNQFNRTKDFTPWHISRRLNTIGFLLENQLKPGFSLKSFVKPLGSLNYFSITGPRATLEDRYWFLVARMFKHHSDTEYMSRLTEDLLPDMESLRLENEFPDFEIEYRQAYEVQMEAEISHPRDDDDDLVPMVF